MGGGWLFCTCVSGMYVWECFCVYACARRSVDFPPSDHQYIYSSKQCRPPSQAPKQNRREEVNITSASPTNYLEVKQSNTILLLLLLPLLLLPLLLLLRRVRQSRMS